MLKLKVDISGLPEGVKRLAGILDDRAELNQALGERLEDELVEYFRSRGFEPNKRGWAHTGWWNKVADGTLLTGYDSEGATVSVVPGDAEGFALRLYGGTVRPKTAEYLTIPLIEEANGRRTSEFPDKLFRLRGTDVLARSDDSEKGFEGVYWLTKSVTREADAEALPATETLEKALADEAGEFVRRALG